MTTLGEGLRAGRALADPGHARPATAPDESALLDAATRGLARIDAAGVVSRADDLVVWTSPFAGACALRVSAEGLFGRAAGIGLPIQDVADVERFLELALRACLGRLRTVAAPAPARLREPERTPARTAAAAREPASLMPRGPLLSQDELAALRGDEAVPA